MQFYFDIPARAPVSSLFENVDRFVCICFISFKIHLGKGTYHFMCAALAQVWIEMIFGLNLTFKGISR